MLTAVSRYFEKGANFIFSWFRNQVEDSEILNGGEQKTTYRPRRTLLQMHIMNYMLFIREKATNYKIWRPLGGGSPSPFESVALQTLLASVKGFLTLLSFLQICVKKVFKLIWKSETLFLHKWFCAGNGCCRV